MVDELHVLLYWFSRAQNKCLGDGVIKPWIKYTLSSQRLNILGIEGIDFVLKI